MSTIFLRSGVEVENPLELALRLLDAYSSYEADHVSGPASVDERDLRLANRAGARIPAAEIAATLERRDEIGRALREVEPGASLASATRGEATHAVRYGHVRRAGKIAVQTRPATALTAKLASA